MDKNSFRKKLGKIISRQRKYKKWSQRLVARESGLSLSAVQCLEYGWANTQLYSFVLVCHTLGVKPSDVLLKMESEYEDLDS